MKLISILLRKTILDYSWIGFPGGSDGKASACNAGDLGSILGSGRSPGRSPSSTLAWKIPWTEEPCRLQSMGSQSRTRLNDFTSLHFHSWIATFSSFQVYSQVSQSFICTCPFFLHTARPYSPWQRIETGSVCSPGSSRCCSVAHSCLTLRGPWTAAHQASLPLSRGLPKFTSICVTSSSVRVPVSVSPLPLVTPSLFSTSWPYFWFVTKFIFTPF